MTNSMYITAAEAKQMNLPSMDEQIARYNAAVLALKQPKDADHAESIKEAARVISHRKRGVVDDKVWRTIKHAEDYLWAQVESGNISNSRAFQIEKAVAA